LQENTQDADKPADKDLKEYGTVPAAENTVQATVDTVQVTQNTSGTDSAPASMDGIAIKTTFQGLTKTEAMEVILTTTGTGVQRRFSQSMHGASVAMEKVR
jgi:hypothetical protein